MAFDTPTTARSEPSPEIADRIARFARTRDSNDLWPGVGDEALAAARRQIERVVRSVLADPVRITPLEETPAATARALSIAAYSIGVGALLGRWIADDRVTASAELRAALTTQLDHGRAYAMRVERELLPTIDALLAAGITPVVIKGFQTARVYWDDVGVRPAADVDLVVRPEEIDATEAVLLDRGFNATTPRTSRPYKRHWSPSADERVFSIERADVRNPWRVDLHDSFDRGFGGGAYARLDALRDRLRPFTLAGRPLLAAEQPLALLVLASHIGHEINSMRLMRLVEIVHVIRRDLERGALDWEALLDAMRRTGSARFMYPAFALAEYLAPGAVDHRIIVECWRSSNWAIRHTVRRLVPSGSSPDREGAFSLFMWADGPVDLARRVLRRIVERSGDGTWRRWRKLVRRTLRGRIGVGAPDERSGAN